MDFMSYSIRFYIDEFYQLFLLIVRTRMYPYVHLKVGVKLNGIEFNVQIMRVLNSFKISLVQIGLPD